jgi:hypothetical protein
VLRPSSRPRAVSVEIQIALNTLRRRPKCIVTCRRTSESPPDVSTLSYQPVRIYSFYTPPVDTPLPPLPSPQPTLFNLLRSDPGT